MLTDKTIEQLVKDNHSLAAAFNFLGIHFENYTEHTLADICIEKGWKLEVIIQRIDEILNSTRNDVNLDILPIDLLIEYLKHNHFIFIKQRLPFISSLIKDFEGDDPEIKNELKMVFPLFLQDFVEHIYEEEDTLFNYVLLLNEADHNIEHIETIQQLMKTNSISNFQSDHEIHDDPFKGLRNLTQNFNLDERFDLKTKVVLSELKKLDVELQYHAKVENEILFLKANRIEQKVLSTLGSLNLAD